ncbi:unnamed protein product, partial [marine sediment metagenome]
MRGPELLLLTCVDYLRLNRLASEAHCREASGGYHIAIGPTAVACGRVA